MLARAAAAAADRHKASARRGERQLDASRPEGGAVHAAISDTAATPIVEVAPVISSVGKQHDAMTCVVVQLGTAGPETRGQGLGEQRVGAWR